MSGHDVSWGRRDEVSLEGVPIGATDPILDGSKALMLLVRQQGRMKADDVAHTDPMGIDQFARRSPQDGDVVRH